MTKAVAYLTHLAESRKLLAFSKELKLSYVYLWQLKTPKTDSRGRPVRDRETGRIVYRRSPSFKTINRLRHIIPTEYWYEEETAPSRQLPPSPAARPSSEDASTIANLWALDDDPFCGVVSAWNCDPELSDRSGRFASPLPKIILDFPF